MSSRRLAKATAAYTVLGFLPLGVSFLLLPIYTVYLDPAEFGALTEANLTLSCAQLLVLLALDAAYARFFFDYTKESGGRDRLLGNILAVLMLLTAIYGVILALVGGHIFRAFWQDLPLVPYAPLSLISALIGSVQYLVFLYYRNEENLAVAALVAVTVAVLSGAGTALAVMVLHMGTLGAFAGKMIGPLIGAAIGFAGPLRRAKLQLDPVLLRAIFRYSLPLVGYSLLAYVLFNGDRLLIARWFSTTELGIYAFAAVLISPIELILQAAQQAAQPTFFRTLGSDPDRARVQAGRMYVLVLNASIVGLIALSSLAEWLIRLIDRAPYLSSVKYIPLLGFAQLFRVLFCAENLSASFSKRTEVLTAATAISIGAGVLSAYAARGVFGPLSVGIGVLGWKSAQLAISWFLGRRAGCVHIPLRGALLPMITTGVWMAVITFKPGAASIAHGLGALAALTAGVGLLRDLKASLGNERIGDKGPATVA
jgi:O-antigen/teichoic acid export membrane protein